MFFVSYVRVSTTKQGTSGLGLEAQQQTIEQYVAQQGGTLLKQFTEVESGARTDRPELTAALNHCKLTDSVLLVAKLDRLSRDLHFVTGLEKTGVTFVVCDFPSVNSFTIHMFAALAQYERELISARTKAALTALKARGTRLGNPENLTPEAAAAGRTAGRTAQHHRATEFATTVGPVIEGCRVSGMSLRDTADHLNETGAVTPRGERGRWTACTVRRVLERTQQARQAQQLM